MNNRQIFLGLVAGVPLVLANSAIAESERHSALTMDVPYLVEEAASAGVNHIYDGPWEHFVGGGVAVFDCNQDRLPDLMMAGGSNPASLYVNASQTAGPLRFEQTAAPLPAKLNKHTTGLYPVDVDNDGYMDVVALRVGENLILKGGPDCSFSIANSAMALNGGRDWTTAFAATFEQGQAFPTLAFGNYVDRSAPGSPWGTCHDNVLFRPTNADGEATFDDPLPLVPGHCALSMIFTDWNRSGEPALRISNDRQYYREGEEQLWRMPAGRAPSPYRASDGWQRVQIWGMGIAEADLNADGYPEYALTSMGDTKLQTRDEEADSETPAYRDVAFERGATAHRPYTGDDLKPSTGWHSQFADINNDGLLDLFIAKGNVEKMPDFAEHDPDNLLLGSHDDRFVEAGDLAGIALPTKGRGGAVADLNMDGMLDLVVVNRGQPATLFRNLGARADPHDAQSDLRRMGNWLAIELQQQGKNRHAVGATITMKSGNETRTRKIQVGGGHASGQMGFVHVGTGVAERASIRIQWPDGEWSAPYRVFANNFVIIKRHETDAQYWYPPSNSR